MLNPLYSDPGHCRPGEVAEEHPPYSVAQGDTKALPQRLGAEAAEVPFSFQTLNIGYG